MMPSASAFLLLGPMITLVYPLYASVRAIESSSDGSIQQWLTYWVLFTLIRLLEYLLGNVLGWLLIWPYARVIVTSWLVLPYFGGAASVYEHYIRPCVSTDPQKLYIWLFPKNKDFILSGADEFLLAANRYIQENGDEALLEVISKGKSEVPTLSRNDTVIPWSLSPEKAQREWTCALCVATTTSEGDLRSHLQGKKHKAKEEMREHNHLFKHTGKLGLMIQGTDITSLVEDFNQIKETFVRSLKRRINPFTRPLRWCIWEKPKMGWIKLNTDGSRCLQKASLGGLLRDHLGCPTCGFVSKAPRDGIFSLEIWAIWRGLILALGQGVTSIWVESDSMSAVLVINKKCPCPTKDANCLKQILKLLEKFKNYKVSHSWREANRAADYLAKMNLNGRDVVLWPGDFPKSLHKIIKEDAEEKVYLRL